ncbi:putative cytochrome P450 oxidoreductase [Lasiodiplodia theobromae]|uniref:putative cytochrome P450 oxidoreductase n=1 Tax=Lasiodiplodia theobromae TaxID=45133 RepID=UPI0015C316D5|nr:putative cytochrome P450 oxidoreductase [Lasiodiplodia theobromae]KAF4539081.1 putative cytochrome P450 oxidoreductase [Lasiodiplodia theobromae]
MAFSSVIFSAFTNVYICLPLLVVAYVAYTRYFTGLSHIPGPGIASISNFWKINAAWHQDMPKRNIALHREHGPLVRIGPNMISVDDPAALPIIYGFKPIFTKTAFYPIVEALYKGKLVANLFTTRSEKYHAHLKRSSVNAYSMTALGDLEPQVQPVIDLFLQKIHDVGAGGTKPFDIGTWAQYFAFDALGQINFSEDLGFLRTGTDVGNSIGTIDGLLAYLSIIGQAPWLHKLLLGNPLVHRLLPLESSNQVQNFAVEMITKRMASIENDDKPLQRDMLARLLEVSSQDDAKLSLTEIIGLTTTNLIAGSDSTAIGLRAILYFLCRSPAAYGKLQREIDEAFAAGELEAPTPRYADAAKLPYLQAVVTEALRAHAATGFVLEREVPAGGAEIAGQAIPGGTIVGINSWVMHANKEVYGEDAEAFRPERWFEDDQRVREMKRCNMSFGAGPRVCIGRNISMMEIIKFIPALMRRFDFKLANPEQEWEVLGHWFTKQTNLDMIFTPRV